MIIKDKKICSGKPIISETRITVGNIIYLIINGWHIDDILNNYSSLKEQDIYDCIIYKCHRKKLLGGKYD